MTTASALYEVYKTLPKQTRRAFKDLIKTEEETPSVLMLEIEEGLKQVKEIRQGKVKPKSMKEVLRG